MYNPIYMSNNFLSLAYQQKERITSMKMQKMLYFLYRDYLQGSGIAIFSERFSVWKYGPVLETVYHTYKRFGSGGIIGYGGNPAYSIREEDDPLLEKLLKKVWSQSLPYSGIGLSRLTHHSEGAWYKAWSTGLPFLRDEDILADLVQIG